MALSDGPVSGGPVGAPQGPPVLTGRSYPYLIQAGVKLKIANVRVEINTGTITGTGPKIRGTQAGGFNVPATTLSLVSGTVYQANNIEVTTAFTANLTVFYDTFDIDWEVSRDGSTWESAGTSSNQIYVCLANPVYDPVNNPILSSINMFRTVVHLACSSAGATDADSAVAKTWALFSGLNVKTWDQKELLHYYLPHTTFGNNTSVAALLKYGTGQCLSWAHMLQDAWTINGVGVNSNSAESSYYTVVTVISHLNDGFFWVKTWSHLPSNDSEWFSFESLASDMQPPPSGDTYGYYDDGGGVLFKNEDTLLGQNSDPDAPSQKVFNNHQFVKYTNHSNQVVYYDPSYGAKYDDAADFQSKALIGFGHVARGVPSINPQKLQFQFTRLGGSTVVVFSA